MFFGGLKGFLVGIIKHLKKHLNRITKNTGHGNVFYRMIGTK
jgi:hypothetical protein